MGSGASATSRLLTRARPTAIAVASDTKAVSVLAELARRGLRVPEDMSVVGFGDMPGWEFCHPALAALPPGSSCSPLSLRAKKLRKL